MLLLATIDGRDHHETGDWHPEQPARLGAALRGVDEAGLGDAVVRVEPREATLTELMRVHPLLYIDALEQLSDAGGGELDPDTVVSTGSAATARLAAGTGIAAIEALERGDGDVAFVAVRPPGHHARRDRGMGFCLYNNVAVAAAALATKGERVLVLDWDVHHGNGTQDIFWNDPNVLYVSTHQAPLYPGTGRISETGGERAPGSIVNLPFPAGATGDVFLRALDEVVEPIVSAFSPTWVLASAGFDAHRDDPLAELQLTSGDFADIAARVAAYAPQPGRLALFLEGGYDLDALRRSIAASLSACFDSRIPCERSSSGGPGVETVGAAKRIREQLAERGVS